MRNIGRLLCAAWIMLLPVGVAAQQPLRWQPTLESAKRLAVQTDRLVLIHFWADWCQSCQQMDRAVFAQPGVASAVEGNYVPVKVNADYFPTTCKQYGVTMLPTDIIITPQGQQIDKVLGPLTASDYVARLNRVASARKQGRPGAYARIPPQGAPPQATSGYGFEAPVARRQPDQPYANSYDRQRQAAVAPPYLADQNRPQADVRTQQPPETRPPAIPPQQAPPPVPTARSAQAGPAGQPAPGQPAPGQRASSNPPLGLDGYCPVTLNDDMRANRYRWTLGDRRWGAIHRGRTYLFAGPEQQRRFLAAPDQYAPVLSGYDPVIALDQGQTVPGRREHGVLFGNNVYLFASEASLEKFSANPRQYAQQVLQAMRTGGTQRQRFR